MRFACVCVLGGVGVVLVVCVVRELGVCWSRAREVCGCVCVSGCVWVELGAWVV